MRPAPGAKRTRALLGAAAVLMLCTAPNPASAHNRSISYSTWRLDETGADVELRIKLLELTRRPPDHAWTESLPRHLDLFAGSERCTPRDAERVARAQVGWARFRWRVDCHGSGPHSLNSRLLYDVAVAHTHFARVEREAGATSDGALEERVLITGRDSTWSLDDANGGAEPSGTSIGSYLALGLEHILEGWDHLAFVLALLLLAGTLREVVSLVTSFTLAHSLTLALAVTGFLRPESTAVEVLIGFSIALVAAENGWLLAGRDPRIRTVFVALLVGAAVAAGFAGGVLRPLVWLGLGLFSFCHFGLMDISQRPARLRAAVAFGFGLIHGLGFAGILMEVELPPERLVQALFGFNVGVEAGQLAVVALVWPLLHAIARISDGRWHRVVAEGGSAAVLALGLYWAVVRNWA